MIKHFYSTLFFLYFFCSFLFGKSFNTLNYNGVYIAEFFILFYVFILGILLILNKRIIFPKYMFALIALYILYGTFILLLNEVNNNSLKDFVIVFYSIFIFIAFFLANNFSFKNPNKYLKLLLIILSIIFLNNFFQLTKQSISLNIVPLGLIILSAFIFRKDVNKSTTVLLILISLLCIINSLFFYFNRSFFIGLIFSIILIILINKDIIINKLSYVFVFKYLVFFLLLSVYSYLYFDISHSGTASWRLEVWSNVFARFFSNTNLLFGNGFVFPVVEPSDISDYAKTSDPHNSFITVLYQLGIFGFIFFSCAIFYFIISSILFLRKYSVYYKNSNYKFYALFFSFFIFCFIFSFFNVALEGPHHGIWFWSSIGFALSFKSKFLGNLNKI